jgi:hypothetical protein
VVFAAQVVLSLPSGSVLRPGAMRVLLRDAVIATVNSLSPYFRPRAIKGGEGRVLHELHAWAFVRRGCAMRRLEGKVSSKNATIWMTTCEAKCSSCERRGGVEVPIS